MGAGGSTAASCSSLDLANHRQHYRQHQHHLHKQPMQTKYRIQANALPGAPKPTKGPAKSSSNLSKQSSHSNFDLTQDHLMHEGKQTNWFGDASQVSEAYHLSDAYNGARPILVLPKKGNNKPVSPVHVISGAKRSNAGVASRIHQHNQRQLNRANELKKFSDSLPSLNNLLDPQNHLHQQQRRQPYYHGELISPVSPYSLSPPTNYCLGGQQDNLLLNHKSAKQQQHQLITIQNHRSDGKNNNNNNNHPNVNLVNRCDDSSYRNWSSSSAVNEHQHSMKKAISLSSLHNSHNNHRYSQQQPQQQQRLAPMNHGVSQCNNKQLVSNCSAKQSHVKKNEFFSNNTCDLQQQQQQQQQQNQPCNNASYMKQQQMQYNQPTPLAKKILKFKQVAANSGLSSKRYKKKQKQIQQQQGCPVLPPLPTSQSLHELIQLRATENGQRMRTTGTLRGPLGSGEAGSKVNLVVELLENRRQQKMSEQQHHQEQQQQLLTRDSTETMLSQASSSDDGIHDVSISGDQSTGDSRNQFSTLNTDNSLNDVRNNGYNSSHRLSIISQQEDGRVGRQRIFDRNHQSSDRSQHRFGNNTRQNQQHQQPSGRPQSQKMDRVKKSCMQKSADNQHQPHKSTLKRSVSHSALQSNLHNLELNNDDDEDESDDLNELAKFLYQFKQRQQSNKDQLGALDGLRKPDLANVVNSQNSSSPQQEQQSPNSTTSSSGFASSTCTSNSISSSVSDEPRQHNFEKSATPIKSNLESNQKKQPGRKKYPAPQRPNDTRSQSQTQIQSNSGTKIVSAKEQTASNNNKNLISGQLKLSSSLLSIVDEYNSTLRTNDRTSPAINNLNSNLKLTSVLLGEANKMQADKNLPPEARRLTDSAGGSAGRSCSKNNSSSTTSSHCHQQQHYHQLEQLRRYTQMRQMSQSELALNHLTSSSGHPRTQIPQVKGKRDCSYDQRNNNNNKPYKSKLINIIRRISDKSEVADCGGGAAGRLSRLSGCSAAVSASPDPITVVGNQISGRAANQMNLNGQKSGFEGGVAINQGEMIAPYSNQCKQKYNHSKLLQKTPDGKSCLSESLCDLNFDCDFELIKNCGNEQRRAGAVTSVARSLLPGGSAGSLLAPADPSLLLDGGAERHCHNEMVRKHYDRHHQAINLSRGENNWRLVPNPLSLDKQTCLSSSKEFQQQQHLLPTRQLLDEEKEKGISHCSKGKLHAGPATDKLASQQQVKLKWSAGGWLMNNIGASGGSGDGSSSRSSNRTKGKELQQQQLQTLAKEKAQERKDSGGKGCLSKMISNSRTPLSIASSSSSSSAATNNNSNGGSALSSEQAAAAALIESDKSFAKVNSEAKQLLNELDHSLDLVSGRYPFSRKVALSWWKKGCDEYPGTHEQHIINGEGKFVQPNEFAISSSASDSDFDLDDDNDDYASINRAMINATFDVDVNQTKLNDNLNSRSIEPGSPSDSFTFSVTNSPASGPYNTATAVAAKLQLQLGSSNHSQLEQQPKGENHMSKQSVCQTNGCLLANKQQGQIYSQTRNSNSSSSSHGNHVILSTTSHGMSSHGVSGISASGACNNGSRDSSRIKSTHNGSACIGANKRIVSYDGERMIGDGGGVGGKVESKDKRDGKVVERNRIDPAPIAANNRFHDKNSGNMSGSSKLSQAGGCMNQDLCAQEHEVGAKTMNESHNKNDNDDDDVSWLNDTNIKSNRLLSKCQFDGNGKRFSASDDDGQNGWNQHDRSSQIGCGHFCGVPLKMNDKNGKNSNSNNCASCCYQTELEGIKSDGSASDELPAKLDMGRQTATYLSIQGQQSCGLGQLAVPLSSCQCCCSMVARTVIAPTICAIARNNEYTDHRNGQEQAVAVKQFDRQSEPKEQLNGISDNGRQMIVVDNLEPLEMRSSNFGASCRQSCSSVGSVCNSDKKTACKCCSSGSGGGQSKGVENIFSKSRDLHAGNGVTYSKTTALKSEELKNKLITQQQQQQPKPVGTSCHCSSVGKAENSFSTTVTHTTAAHSNNPEIGKTAAAVVVTARNAYRASLSPKPLAASSNSFSKPVEVAPTERGFYHYEMERIYSRPNDKQKTTDKIVSREQHENQQQQEQQQRQDRAFATTSNLDNRPPNLDNCCQVSPGEERSSCRLASCHHPSSSCRFRCEGCNACGCEPSYNEDVKTQLCVMRENLILDAGNSELSALKPTSNAERQLSSSLDKGIVVDKMEVAATSGEAASTNCSHRLSNGNFCCCRNHITQKKQQQQLSHYPNSSQTTNVDQQQQEMNGKAGRHFYGVGKFSSPNRTTTATTTSTTTTATNGDLHPSSKSSPNGRPLCAAALSGTPRLIYKSRVPGKPICRSNSELVPGSDKGLIKGRISIGQSSSDNRQQGEQRLLSLRNSLLNNDDSKTSSRATTITAQDALGKSTKLASGQMSSANYYKGGCFISPYKAHEQDYRHNHHGSTTALNDQMNADDNFILKRKTPNAGLKSLC